ncbi:molybdate ABC transporter substrate-binding protein [Virgibacillus kekensis]|uniref:Molybdate ABC transporter substrate-binding protein n=1 Tax=Virgibacillus kekensis TaxID=202261 RepID=A0ABV9DHZ0_9BACI
MKYIQLLLFAAVMVLVSGCSQNSGDGEKILVSAAASMSGVLSELTRAFNEEYPNTTLTLNYGASGKLAQQIEQGAPVDVFLSANQRWMDSLEEKDMIDPKTRVNFTQNKLVLITAKDSNIKVDSLENLASMNLNQIAVGNPKSVPAGSYTKQALTSVGVWNTLDEKLVHAKDVRQVLTYAESGNTDIGFVYASDLERSELVEEIMMVDQSLYETIKYPAAVISSSEHKEKAKAFIEFLKSDKAQSILKKYGFSG